MVKYRLADLCGIGSIAPCILNAGTRWRWLGQTLRIRSHYYRGM